MDHGTNTKITRKIKVYGIVQGVGFRPLVYRIAGKYDICGTVRNIGGSVEIIVQASEAQVDAFLEELKCSHSGSHEIVRIETEDLNSDILKNYINEQKDVYTDRLIIDEADNRHIEYIGFNIISSEAEEQIAMLPTDLPVCAECRKELYDQSDRRYHNPFISCMHCGPRYTIIEELPFDRETTVMRDYELCEACWEEYTSPESRRFHAQTISCNDCGPYLIFRGRGYKEADAGSELMEEEALLEAVKLLKAGGVIAVKGIGGYHFVCSPFREEAVRRLRRLKGREEKPFAVMFGSVGSIEDYCLVSEEERKLLESKACPIVLLYPKEKNSHAADKISRDMEGVPDTIEPRIPPLAPSVNQGSLYIGAFLPYTGIQLELIRHCGPLVMTSGNISDQPIIREEEEMFQLVSSELSSELDGILYHTRRIVRSVDDSVIKVISHKPQMIRRSRGYVPYPVFLPKVSRDIPVFAAGGDLKAAFCLYRNGHAVVSQHFGDLGQTQVIREYEASIEDMMRLLKVKPELAVCDLHPNYFSSGHARTLGIPLLEVQHHHAHVASVMAEHQLQGPVIGVAFDGTGYGTDDTIWGGEFLVCTGPEFIRAAHLTNTPMLGGDQSMKDARKTSSCYLIHSGLEEYLTDDRKAVLRAALESKVNTIMTSSMGRLFDAVASILGIHHENRYEGECAVMLEKEALLALKEHRTEEHKNDEQKYEVQKYEVQKYEVQKIKFQKIGRISYPTELSFAIYSRNGKMEIDPKPLLKSLCSLRDSVEAGKLALYFHLAVADMTVRVCRYLREEMGINSVALCGGVFQNTILTERTLELLTEEGFLVYVNVAVPPNDGAISLGQIYIGLMQEEAKSPLQVIY